MKIIHVNLAKGFRGGERQTELLIRALAVREDARQWLACRRDSPLRARLAEVSGLTFIDADHQLAGHGLAGRLRADVVHAHDAKAVHWAGLHRWRHGVPYLLTRRVDAPVKDKLSNRLFYRGAARRVAISSLIKRQLEARDWGEVALIPSALSGLKADPAQAKALRADFPGKYLVGHVGALVDRHKGQRVLIDAARRLQRTQPDLQVLFFGQGEDAEVLETEAADLANVTFMGFRDNIGDYLPGLDLFAFPSRNEGLGSVLLDVMDAGVPIVASRVGGIPDIVHDDDTGLLVPPGDAEALATAIACLHDDPARAQRLAVGASAQLDRYTPKAMADAYWRLYRDMI
ncbi:glycosyltransferase involved in cell wall biosynthesis [Onishia taeanensis]|uniref:Glycosyltransferase involved in cell wall biosynthesis n=1 Tax=Onishia taeanensis TaxID=284577 RepID=A0A328XLB0_9GAMM|nr:glycosyltransferase family 4 protein [Halomonas taeanensis]RAR59572.1 glycosyltransferase involved in cell wall biosynthesis [Halomonas taeanensis]